MSVQHSSVFRGIGISNGKTCGKLRFYKKTAAPLSTPRIWNAGEERERFLSALQATAARIRELERRARRSIGADEAEIFEIHAMLLSDEDFIEATEREITRGKCAEEAVTLAAAQFSELLRGLDDPYLSARAADLGDISEQLLRALSGGEATAEEICDEPYILVATDLTPSETVSLERSQILGFVTLGGTPNSHTAILARAMGIPALVSVGELPESADGEFALLDAATGTLTVSPSEEARESFEKKMGEETAIAREHDRYLRSLINKPAVTRGGKRMMIYANVGDEHEALAALESGADGIGLLRSEFLYLSLDRFPTEEELYDAYRRIVLNMQGKRIVIRTLDIGADKQIPYFELPHEENPALGFRAVRICLSREEIFRTQLRAILRASAHGTVSLMIPMIVSVDEVRKCKQILQSCKEELEQRGEKFDARIEFGIMVETPAAAIMSAELAREVDFFSVGTNDLTQYTLAADRQNPLLADLGDQNTEPILRLIRMAAQAIHESGGWIGICGEMAADLRLTQSFADMDIDELSVSVPYLLGLREKVTECK